MKEYVVGPLVLAALMGLVACGRTDADLGDSPSASDGVVVDVDIVGDDGVRAPLGEPADLSDGLSVRVEPGAATRTAVDLLLPGDMRTSDPIPECEGEAVVDAEIHDQDTNEVLGEVAWVLPADLVEQLNAARPGSR